MTLALFCIEHRNDAVWYQLVVFLCNLYLFVIFWLTFFRLDTWYAANIIAYLVMMCFVTIYAKVRNYLEGTDGSFALLALTLYTPLTVTQLVRFTAQNQWYRSTWEEGVKQRIQQEQQSSGADSLTRSLNPL